MPPGKNSIPKKWILLLSASFALATTLGALAQDAHSVPARAVVSDRMTAHSPPPIGVNEFGDMGGTAHSKGNLIPDWGFEPGAMRFRYRVLDSGTENGRPWVTLDGNGITRAELVTSGFMSGADYRVYRIVDAGGNPLPLLPDEDYLDLSQAARYERVDAGQVPAAGTPGFPDGGWIAEGYFAPGPANMTRSNLTFTDNFWIENGQTYYYLVAAIGPNGEETFDFSDPATLAGASELSATPQAGISGVGPFIVAGEGWGFNDMRPATQGGWFSFAPSLVGAEGSVTWELLDGDNQPIPPPAGLEFHPQTGQLVGSPTSTPPPTLLRFRATAVNGSATRDFILNNTNWTTQPVVQRPAPPQNVAAVAGNGFVHLTWDASPSPGVLGYRIYRSPVPYAQRRERVYLAAGAPQPQRWDYIHFDKKVFEPDPMWSHPRVRSGRVRDIWHQWVDAGHITYRRVPHPVPPPPAMLPAGEGCLSIASDTSAEQEINGPTMFFPVTGEGESLWYGFLEPGETYRYEAWMRQEGLPAPQQVRLGFWGQYTGVSQTFALDAAGGWTLVGFDFTAPSVPTTGTHGGPAIFFSGPGTIFLDNIRLFKANRESGVPGLELPAQRNLDALMEFSPATGEKGVFRRLWSALAPHFMEGNLNLQRNPVVTYDWYQSFSDNNRPTIPQHLHTALLTGDSPTNRVKPWLNINANASIEEWEMLMEYLAEPIDPGDPQQVAEKPWAYLRYQQRGVATPWVDEFPKIVIEFSNETWHNKSVEEQWAGWGRAYWVNDGGREFGLYARYILDGVMASSARLSQLRADGKIVFQLGNSYWQYAQDAMLFTQDAEAVGHATYIGPRWETGDTPNEAFTEDGVQATLLAHAETFATELEAWRKERERMAEQHGIFYDFYAYEGGPSGYSLPGTTSPEAVAIGELYGKSLAMASASLDAWLSSYEAGFREMALYSYAARFQWGSHTHHTANYPDGFRPHVAWLALQLRNRYASGHMLAVDFPNVPVITRQGRAIPLVTGHAFRDGSRLAVFLISRKLDGARGGLDFGDGSTPVTLSLPANPVGPATLYAIAGDPRASNIDEQEVTVVESQVNLQRESEIVLPAGSIYLYVVETDAGTSSEPPATPTNLTIEHLPSHNLLTWDAVPGAASYVVRRSATKFFGRFEEDGAFPVSGTSFEDWDGAGGSEFYYRVSAVNEWGEGLGSLITIGGENPNPPVLPAPVLAGAGVGDGRLLLEWQTVSGATGYRVGYRAGSGVFSWITVGDTAQQEVTGLLNGVSYQWTVQAISPAGRGLMAAYSEATPLDSSSEQTLVQWDFAGLTSFEASLPPQSRASVFSVSPLVRGSGFAIGGLDGEGNLNTSYHPIPGTFGFIPHFDFGNFGQSGGGDLAMALDRDYYVGFSTTVAGGYRANLSLLQTGATYPYQNNQMRAVLRYRVGDGGWVTAAGGARTIQSGGGVSGGLANMTALDFDLSVEAALQGVEGLIEFRIYLYSPDESARYCRAALGRQAANDLALRGSYEVLPPTLGQRFRQWRQAHFLEEEILAGHAEPGAAPFGTARNWEFFLFGGDVESGTPGQPLLNLEATPGGARYRLRVWARSEVADGVWLIEASENLVEWDANPARFTRTPLAVQDEFRLLEIEDTMPASDRRFYRFRTDLDWWD